MFGVGLDSIKVSLEAYQQTSMRMQRLMIDGVTIINDTYNSNPVSIGILLSNVLLFVF
jgi:UDP-N-acetylmuramyl pentapeptide synthase